MDKTAEQIAAGLTRAQRRAMTTGRQPSGMGKWPLQNSLIDKRLATTFPTWTLTPLGKAVRAILQEQSNATGR